MLGQSKNYDSDITELIETSIIERKESICDTWDAVKVMSLPWGVKDFIEPNEAEGFTTFVETLVNTSITLPSGYVADILKGDVKEKKGKYLLIMRYILSHLV